MPFGPWPPGGETGSGTKAINPPPNTNPANVSPGSVLGSVDTRWAKEDHTHGGPLCQSFQNAGVLGPATDVQLTTPNVTSVRSGLFHVVVVISADASAVSTQVITGGHDATTDATTKSGTGGAGPFNGAATWTIQLIAGSTHTFFVKAHVNSGGGTNTTQPGWAQISIIEF